MILQAVTAVGAIVALVLVVVSSRNESRDAKRLATQNMALLERIQASRVEAQFNTCQESNSRHDATVSTLMRVLARDLAHPPAGFTKADIRANLQGNLFLINSLVPRYVQGSGSLAARERQGCDARARALTRSH